MRQYDWNRRKFLGSAIGALGAMSLSCPALGRMGDPQTRMQAGAPVLLAAPGQFDVGGGQRTAGLGYNNGIPGPAFHARSGRPFNAVFVNGMDQPTTVHWHGMVVRHAMDGHPLDLVPPGGQFVYSFPVVQRACMNWYHPHPHGLTGQQVNLGLAGPFIIHDSEELALPLPKRTSEKRLIVRDADFDNQGNLKYTPKSSGFIGKFPLVNGKLNLRIDVNADVYRLRILNGANARVFRLARGDGLPFTLIGNDGGLLEFPVTLSEIEFGPGERLDLLIDFRQHLVGDAVYLWDLNRGWSLVEFSIVNDPPPRYSLPGPTDRLSTIEPLPLPQRAREFAFEGMSRINGQTYELERMDFEVPFGETELWRFVTAGNGPHPVHVHGASFQVVSRMGGRGEIFPWEHGWKDTVLVQDGETVDVLIRFDRYADQLYLIHCHQLEHEDNGMMSNFRVLPIGA